MLCQLPISFVKIINNNINAFRNILFIEVTHQIQKMDQGSKIYCVSDAPNSATFYLNGETHTIANLIKSDLLLNEHVQIAGYVAPHPQKQHIKLTITTDGSETPLKKLLQSCKNLQDKLEFLEVDFDDKIKKYEESCIK